jgi:methoxymalonate biosynthesis acyl carrier protein
MTDARDRIHAFVSGHLQSVAFADEDDLFGDGLVNSLFAMQLVMFLEQDFGIEVTNDDLDMDNFRSIAAMAAFVARKRIEVPALATS